MTLIFLFSIIFGLVIVSLGLGKFIVVGLGGEELVFLGVITPNFGGVE
jgi:hypothetical protein